MIVEPRLDKANNAQWYVAAAQGTDTIEVAYLDGMDTPYLEQQEGFTVDGIARKVRIDAVWLRWTTAGWSNRVGHKSRGRPRLPISRGSSGRGDQPRGRHARKTARFEFYGHHHHVLANCMIL